MISITFAVILIALSILLPTTIILTNKTDASMIIASRQSIKSTTAMITTEDDTDL